MASEDPNPATTPAERKIALEGKEYTEAELTEALRGTMRQADYTRKTQTLAEERRQFEEWKAEQEAAIAAMKPANPTEDDPWVQRFNALDERINDIHQTLTAREQAEAEETEIQESMRAIESQLSAYSVKPGFNRQEILQTMQTYGLDRPEQVEAAYQIVAGPKIAAAMAERSALSRGVTAPPVLGSNGIAVTAPFASANEAAPGIDASKMSWQELRAAAMADPERPRG